MTEKNARRLLLLGPVTVAGKGKIPRFRSQRTQALLGYLVASKRPSTRNHLASLFWPDADEARRRANLRRELHNLGRVLPGCWEIDQTVVTFAPGANTVVDLCELEEAISCKAWVAATSWVRGQFLEGIDLNENPAFETWLAGERRRWRQLAEQALFYAASTLRQDGKVQEAHQALIRLIQLVPWHEEAHRQLMLLLARQGRFAAALKQYQACRELLESELAIAPSAKTEKLARRIRGASKELPPPLPPRLSPFIGRETEFSTVSQQIADPRCRLLTIVGLGGIGKSRLALEIAQAFREGTMLGFLHGAVFASLVSAETPEEAVAAISNTIGMRFQGQEAGEKQLIAHLRERELLLVLDNYEHLLPWTSLIERLVAEAPKVTLLVTSRLRLQLKEERVYQLTGLPHPTERDRADPAPAIYPAIHLFADAARRIDNRFSLPQHLQGVAEISQLVEGMPLALLLASSWIETLSLPEIAKQIRQNLSFLESPHRNADPRQQSMQAVFQASWDRLSEKHQNLLAALTVFRGAFTATAATSVTNASIRDTRYLINHSLLSGGEGHFTIHELLRQFAAEKLARHQDMALAIQKKHAAYYLGLIAELEDKLYRKEAGAALETLTLARSNLIAAWKWALAHGDDRNIRRAARGFGKYFRLRGPLQEGSRYFQSAVSKGRAKLAEPDSCFSRETCAYLLVERSHFLLDERNFEKAAQVATEALSLAKDSGNAELISSVYLQWGTALYELQQFDEGRRKLATAVALAEEAQAHHILGLSLHQLGVLILLGEHHLEDATSTLQRALQIGRETDDIEAQARSLNTLGIAYIAWDYGRALNYLKESANLFHQLQESWGETIALAHLSMNIGDYEQAQQYCEETVALKRRLGDRQGEGIALVNLASIARQTGDNEEALRRGAQALDLASTLKDGVVAAYAHMFRGHALYELGRYDEALAAYLEALSYWRLKNEAALSLETLAGMARVHWAMADHDRGLAIVEEVVAGLANTVLSKAEEPVRIYLTCFRILDAVGDKRAPSVLADGHLFLQERAAQIQDEKARHSLLHNVRAHAALRREYEQIEALYVESARS